MICHVAAGALEIAEESAVGVIVTDAAGVATFANPAFLELLGQPTDAVVGRSLRESIPVTCREQHVEFRSRIEKGATAPYQVSGRSESGNRVSVVLQPVPLHSPDGTLLGLVTFLHRAGKVERDPWTLLSPRERAVCELLVRGRRPSEIAVELGISVSTVRNHLRFAYKKVDAHSQVELVAVLAGRG